MKVACCCSAPKLVKKYVPIAALSKPAVAISSLVRQGPWRLILQPTIVQSTRNRCPTAGRFATEQQQPSFLQPLVTVICLCQVLALTLAPYAHAMPRDPDTFENVPGQLTSDGAAQVSLSSLMKGEKRKEVETCVRKCVPTCIRGGEGAPGLGPISMRREVVVFKDGFRSRSYCLRECAEVCSLSINTPVAPPVGP